jgi:hypothetical protein
MKKLLILFLAVSFFGLNQAIAQAIAVAPAEEAPIEAAIAVTDNDSEREIAVVDMPKAVQMALQADDYQGWTVAKAWHVKKENKEYYLVKMKRGDEKTKLKFMPDGKLKQSKEHKEQPRG